MKDDDVPSWVRAASLIEGLTLSDVSYTDCKRCGRITSICSHPNATTRANGSVLCIDCVTLLHGSPHRQETLLCTHCGHMEVGSLQEPHTPLLDDEEE